LESLFKEINDTHDRDLYVLEVCRMTTASLSRLAAEANTEALDELWEMQQQVQGLAKGSSLHDARYEARIAVMELSRRIDRAIGVTVRAAQAKGLVQSLGDPTAELPSPKRWVGRGNTRQEMYGITDRVSDEEFEAALSRARQDGNMSRRHVLACIRAAEQVGDWVPHRNDHSTAGAARRRQLIREMAEEGKTSRDMERILGTLAQTVRLIARNNGIEIPAEKFVAKTRVHKADRIMEETVNSLSAIAMSMELVDPAEIDRDKAAGWLSIIDSSVRTIKQVARSIREETL